MTIAQSLNIKKLIFIILITIVVGSFFAFFLTDNMKQYEASPKPEISPSGMVFMIVWSILYILMGISLYIISESRANEMDKKKVYLIYAIQLILNSIWTLIFFGLKARLLSFFWIVALLVVVIYMLVKMYKINNKAGLLQVPYVLWLGFASYLNFAVYIFTK